MFVCFANSDSKSIIGIVEVRKSCVVLGGWKWLMVKVLIIYYNMQTLKNHISNVFKGGVTMKRIMCK